MTRTKLRNISYKIRVRKIERFKQNEQTSTSLLRKVKKRYYKTLNEKSVIDNKLLWMTVKPFLSNKIVGKNKIHLTENDQLIKTDLETAEILNDFFRK